MDFEQLCQSLERLIQNLEFIKSLEDEGIHMSNDHKDMILRNIDSIVDTAKNDCKTELIFDIR